MGDLSSLDSGLRVCLNFKGSLDRPSDKCQRTHFIQNLFHGEYSFFIFFLIFCQGKVIKTDTRQKILSNLMDKNTLNTKSSKIVRVVDSYNTSTFALREKSKQFILIIPHLLAKSHQGSHDLTLGRCHCH